MTKAGRFVEAGDLAEGAELVTANGTATVVRRRWIEGERLVYNFEVNETHTYFVGDTGAWVHNACDLIYGLNSKARAFARNNGGETLADLLPNGPLIPGDWLTTSKLVLGQARAEGRSVKFVLDGIDDLPGVLNGRSYADAVTSGELRFLQSHWDDFSGTVTFVKDGAAMPAGWTPW
jgi:hypothetical protein